MNVNIAWLAGSSASEFGCSDVIVKNGVSNLSGDLSRCPETEPIPTTRSWRMIERRHKDKLHPIGLLETAGWSTDKLWRFSGRLS